MLFELSSAKSADALDDAIRSAAARHKFGVLGVIDLQEKMREKGVDYASECRVYEVCSPHQAKRALEAFPAIATALPCRIAVYGGPGAYKISTMLPTAIMNSFGAPALDEVARDVEAEVVAIVKESA